MTMKGDDINLTMKAKFILPPARQHWATAVTLLPEEKIVCGDRRGSLHLYSYSQSNDSGGSSHNTGELLQVGLHFSCFNRCTRNHIKLNS